MPSPAGVGEVEEAQMPAKALRDRRHTGRSWRCASQALLVSHLIAADRMRRHPDMWEELRFAVCSLSQF